MNSPYITGAVIGNHNIKIYKYLGWGGDCAILNGCIIKGKTDSGVMGNMNGVCMDWER